MENMLWRGAKLGATTGFILAVIFTNCLGLLFYVISPANGFINLNQHLGLLVFAVLCYGYLIGVLPATILGAVIGLLIGLVLTPLKKPLSAFAAGVLGLQVALITNLLFEWLFFSTLTISSNWLLTIPQIICLIASGWMGVRLNRAKFDHNLEGPDCLQTYVLVQGAQLLSVLLPGFLVIPLLPISGLIIAKYSYHWKQAGLLLSALYSVLMLVVFTLI